MPDALEHILSIADPLDPAGYAQRAAESDFPGETFPVLKDKEQRQYGEYRTRRLGLQAWFLTESDLMPIQTPLDKLRPNDISISRMPAKRP